MAPVGSRRSCVVCGKFPKDKKAKPLVNQDDFWKQHAEDIRTGSEVPLKTFLKYFGISLDSVAAFAKAGDVDQVLKELIICNDCSDWVMYGAFLKEKFRWVEQVLRDKIRNAFIAGRLQYRAKSSVDNIAAVVEQIRQCLMPCCVVVDKDAVSDELNCGAEPTTSQACAESPPAKRSRTRALVEEQFVSENVELNTQIITVEDQPASNDNEGEDNGADDNLMDYDDPFDGLEALDDDNDGGLSVQEPSENECGAEASAVMNINMEEARLKPPAKKRPGPKSKAENKNILITRFVGLRPGLSPYTFVISKKCQICKKVVPHYIRHMAMHHHVKPHRYLLNNFWCNGCKNTYQPPDSQTPTGQYLPQHHDAFLKFIHNHSHCRFGDVKPHPCRFCGYVCRHKKRAAHLIIQHEATFHPDMFGADYPLTQKDTEARRAAKQKKYLKRREKILEVRCPAKQVPMRYGRFMPIRKTCPICQTVAEDYQEHMAEHNLSTHPIFLDFFCCTRCKRAYQPPDRDTPTGKYLPQDHDFFLKFTEEHKSCSYTEEWPPHACRYCDKVRTCPKKAAIDCMDHEILTHPERVGEYSNLIRNNGKTYASFKNNPGYCPVCNLEVTAYGLHMLLEHNVLSHWIYSKYFICRHCKLPYEPPNPEMPIGKYQREDRDSFLEFIGAHSNCVKQRGRQQPECRFCKEPLDMDLQLDPFCLIMHQIKQHWELIGEDPNRPLPTAVLRNKPYKPYKYKPPLVTGEAEGTSPQSPVVVLNELKNEICEDDTNTMEDPLMMDDFTENVNSDADNTVQNDRQNPTETAEAIISPETLRHQEEMPQSEQLGLQLDASGVRRSTRSRKSIIAEVDAGGSSTSASEAEDEDIDDEESYGDQEVVEIGSSASEEIEEFLEENVDIYSSKTPKNRIKIRTKKLKKLTWHPQQPSKLSDEDDDEEPDDGSEKVCCVVCDAQRSRPKLQNHYKVKHNLAMKPHEGYFGCRGCNHAFLSPNENIPTGKFIPEDIEYLKDFIRDHESCRNLSKEIHAWKPGDFVQLHFCRYCFKKFQGVDSMADCVEHERRSHEDGNVEADSTQEVQSVFLFYCVYCKFKTDALADVYIHMRSHKKPHRFGCCKCDSQFKDVRELTYHIRLHGTSSEVFDACLLCDAYMDALSIVGHYRQNHGLEMVSYKYFGCWHCEEAFVSEQLERPSGTVFGDDLQHLANFVARHENCKLSRQHPPKEQKCRKCPSTFTTMRQLVEHEEIKHSEGHFVPDLCCGICDRMFLSEEGLQKHSGLHLSEEYGFKADVPFLDCPDCYFSCEIYNKWQFDLHLPLHNPDKFEKDKRFRKVSQRQFVERRVVLSPSVAVCHICGPGPGTNPKTFRNVAQHYHRSHNLIQYYSQMYCFGCKKVFVNGEGAPHLIEGDNPKDEIVQQLKNFALSHKECPDGPQNPVKCIECSLIKKDVCRYLDHYAIHRNAIGRFALFPQLHCLRCDEAFTSILQLRDHLKGKLQAWKCRSCHQQFMTKENYAAHTCSTGTIDPEPEVTSDPPPYLTFRTGGLNCLMCITVFDSLTEFNLHFKYFHNNVGSKVKFECSVCQEVQESATGLAFVSANEDFPRVCAEHETKCKARARKEGSKMCQDFSWPDLTCFVCQETFDSIQRYSAHINEHFGTSADEFCPVCPAVFSETEELRHHVTLHGLFTPRLFKSYFSCRHQSCLWMPERPEAESGRLYPQDLSAFQVFAECHAQCTNPRFKDFNCKFCDNFRAFTSTRLYAHEQQHTKNWQVYCEECGRGFPSELRLTHHMKIHQEKLKFACNQCPYKAKQRSDLKEHMNVHNGARPFICDQCGKDFALKKSLREHVRYVHNKPTEKTSPCTWGCDRMFATRRDARVHELKVHNRPLETRRRNQHRDYGE